MISRAAICLLSFHCSLLFAFTELHEIELAPAGEGGPIVWEVEGTLPFDELILSWNGDRPQDGGYALSLAVCSQGEWSAEIPYMFWGADSQYSFGSMHERLARNSEDILFLQEGHLGDGFRVVVRSEGGASLSNLHRLAACTSRLADYCIDLPNYNLEPVSLEVACGRSQMALEHPRHRDLCSPTSTSTAVNYLLGRALLDPATFADRAHDDRGDIYGNWVLNVAEASDRLGKEWSCDVRRLKNFAQLHAYLCRGLPVVVSVKGELPGAPLPYAQGHLMMVRGYDPVSRRVLVVDSAFPSDNEVVVSYPLDDFLATWSLRKNIAYIFEPTDEMRAL